MRRLDPVHTDAMKQYRSRLAKRGAKPVSLVMQDRRDEVKEMAAELRLTFEEVRVLRCRGLLETPRQKALAVRVIRELKEKFGVGRVSVVHVIAAVTAASERVSPERGT